MPPSAPLASQPMLGPDCGPALTPTACGSLFPRGRGREEHSVGDARSLRNSVEMANMFEKKMMQELMLVQPNGRPRREH